MTKRAHNPNQAHSAHSEREEQHREQRYLQRARQLSRRAQRDLKGCHQAYHSLTDEYAGAGSYTSQRADNRGLTFNKR